MAVKLTEKAQAALDRVVEQFKAGDLSPIVDVARIKLDPEAPANRWTFRNKVMAYAQSRTLDCRGYKQWQEVGRQVLPPEERGLPVYIMGPRTITKEDEDTGNKETILIGFRGIPIYSYQQTEGDGPGAMTYEPRELPPLAEVADALGISIKWAPMLDALGSYQHGRGTITLGAEDAPIFFHELAHAAHAMIDQLNPGQDPHQETVAELSAAVLSELYGVKHTGNAWRYIESYNDDPLKAIYEALGTVEQVITLIEELASGDALP